MKSFRALFLTIGLLLVFQSYSQVAVNTSGNAADASAMLDVSSDTAGVLIPRMSANERDAINSPATGLMVYVEDDDQFYYYDGSNWILINGRWKADTYGVHYYLAPKDSDINTIQLSYTPPGSDQKLTMFRCVNENNTSNYAGAVFVAKGNGPEYSNNFYFAKYGDGFYISKWAGNGVISTDQDLIIASMGQDDSGNPNLNTNPQIIFQVGGFYNYPKYAITRMTLDTNGLKFTGGVRINGFLDEDDFASDSDTVLATQQSIKAYVDNHVYDAIWDADGNTGIQVEESADENYIRFDVDGAESMVVDPSGNVGIGTTSPDYKLDVDGNAAANNMVSIVPLWQGGEKIMVNTSGQDQSNCESALIPTMYNSNGSIDVKLVIRVTSTTATTNNFQLRTHNGTTQSYPITNSDTWTWTSVGSGYAVESQWKSFPAGTTAMEIHLYAWVSNGETYFNSAYLMVRPHQN